MSELNHVTRLTTGRWERQASPRKAQERAWATTRQCVGSSQYITRLKFLFKFQHILNSLFTSLAPIVGSIQVTVLKVLRDLRTLADRKATSFRHFFSWAQLQSLYSWKLWNGLSGRDRRCTVTSLSSGKEYKLRSQKFFLHFILFCFFPKAAISPQETFMQT